jgi:hypothetical protein
MRIVRAPQPSFARAGGRTPAARREQAGERVVRAALAAALDDRYVFVRDLHLPGGTGAVDAVLIGPRILAIVIAVAPSDRPMRVRGLRWESQVDDGRWVAMDPQPSERARRDAARVAYALRSAGLPAYEVAPVVCVVGGAGWVLERPRVPVLRPAELAAAAREGGGVTMPAWPELALRALLVAASVGAGDNP